MATTTISAVTIGVDGSLTYEDIPRGCTPLQERVGGWIEAVSGDDGNVTLWINEEGKLQGLPVNIMGTELWHLICPAMRGRDVLCGPVVVTGGCDDEGETLSIPTGLETALRSVTRIAADLSSGSDD